MVDASAKIGPEEEIIIPGYDLASATTSSSGESPALERALSRLCAWVLAADRLGVAYGLRLGPLQLPPATGEAHRRHCLEALATLGETR